jgi:sec-independent protein translocase protein TatA
MGRQRQLDACWNSVPAVSNLVCVWQDTHESRRVCKMTPALALIGGLGMPELVVILLIALIVFGAARIPEIAKSLGKAVKEFKKGASGADDEAKKDTGKEGPKDT